MGNYNNDRGNRSGGGNRSFGKPRFNNDRGNDRPEMFSAICANCGKPCEVPFRPTGSKPVLCRDCFKNNRSDDSGRSEQRSFDRPSFNRDDNRSRPQPQNAPDYKAQFEMLNAKMDRILALLTPKQTVAPLESAISEETIDEIAEEVQEEKSEVEEKPKKAKIAKAKKSSSSKKE